MTVPTSPPFRSIACPVCGSASFDPEAVGQTFPGRDGDPTYLIVRCRGCSLAYLNPRPAWPDAGPNATPHARRAVEKAAANLAAREGAVLLAGPSDLDTATAAADLDGARSPACVAGLLETTTDPRSLLTDLHQLVGAGGEVVVLTPNADARLMHWFGRRHAALYRWPAHLQVFGTESLTRLAREAGFDVTETFTRADFEAWTESTVNFLADWDAPRWLRWLGGSAAVRLVLAGIEAINVRRNRGGVLGARLRARAPATRPPRSPATPAVTGRATAPVAILGAGVAGLTAARLLHQRGIPIRVFEAGNRIAGLAQSFRRDDGFSHDFGAHFITNRFAAALGVGASCRTVHRFGECVRVDGRTYAYPFGLLRSARLVASAAAERLSGRHDGPPASALELYRRQFGPRLADEIALPLVEAWSGVSAAELAPSVSPPQLDRGIPHVLKLKLASRLSGRAVANGFSRAQPENPHVFHVYPVDGVSVLTERLAEGLKDVIELESRVEAIYVEDERVRGIRVAGADHPASAVISTAPVHVLPKLVRGTDALAPLARFRYRPFTLVNLRFDLRPLLPDVCMWVPDRSFTFFRVTEPPRAMPWLAPPGKTFVTADIGCEIGDAVWTMDDDTLGARCAEELDRLFPGTRSRFLGCDVLRTAVAHPVYLRAYEEDRAAFSRGLPVDGLLSVGRNGEFAHILMEDVFWRTRHRVAEQEWATG